MRHLQITLSLRYTWVHEGNICVHSVTRWDYKIAEGQCDAVSIWPGLSMFRGEELAVHIKRTCVLWSQPDAASENIVGSKVNNEQPLSWSHDSPSWRRWQVDSTRCSAAYAVSCGEYDNLHQTCNFKRKLRFLCTPSAWKSVARTKFTANRFVIAFLFNGDLRQVSTQLCLVLVLDRFEFLDSTYLRKSSH